MDTVACGLLGSNGHQAPTAIPPGPVQLPDTMTEARCSVNAYFYLPGFTDRLQATGRGLTPTDAARNLRATMEATCHELAPAPRAPRTERLAALLARGTEKALAHGDGAKLEHLLKAYKLVVLGMVEEVQLDGVPQAVYRVRSQSEPEHTVYTVQGRVCECPDSRKHAEDDKPYYCKHAIAVLYTRTLDAQEQEGWEHAHAPTSRASYNLIAP